MTTVEIKENKWVEACNEAGFKSVFSDIKFINVYSEAYNTTPRYFVVRQHKKIQVLLSAFSSKTTLSYPIHYMFTPIWVNDREGEIVRNRAVEALLVFLKKRYKKIKIRLPVGFTDIRPFYWQGFTPTHKYTYIKDLRKLEYHANINRILKKADSSYSFEEGEWSNMIETIHSNDLKELGFSRSIVTKVLSSFKKLHNKNKMIIINGMNKGKIVGSDILLVDSGQKYAYMFFISKSYGHYKSGFPALKYDYIFKYLKSMGVEKVDMFGANYSSIAEYKSKFNPELAEFFEVSYSAGRYLFNNLQSSAKMLVKRLIR